MEARNGKTQQASMNYHSEVPPVMTPSPAPACSEGGALLRRRRALGHGLPHIRERIRPRLSTRVALDEGSRLLAQRRTEPQAREHRPRLQRGRDVLPPVIAEACGVRHRGPPPLRGWETPPCRTRRPAPPCSQCWASAAGHVGLPARARPTCHPPAGDNGQ